MVLSLPKGFSSGNKKPFAQVILLFAVVPACAGTTE